MTVEQRHAGDVRAHPAGRAAPGRCGSRMAVPRRVARAAAAAALALAGGGLGVGVPAGAQAPAPSTRVYLPVVSPPPRAVAALELSHARGFYDAAFALELTSATTGAEIRYTTDGTPPTADGAQVSAGPIAITTTTTLRAVAVRAGYTPTETATHTYIFPSAVLRQPESPDPDRYPVAWGRYPEGRFKGHLVPADYAMDPDVVDDPRYRDELAADLLAVPSLSLVTTPDDMWGAPGVFGAGQGVYANPLEEGMAWERPASVELIRADGRPGFQIDAGLRIAGQWSRKPDSTAKHSFSLRFRSRYGPSRLVYPLFDDGAVRSFDTLRLRAGQADALHFFAMKAQYVHDQWGRDSQRDMGALAARGTFVHLYLNGLYWGIYNVTEDVTAAFAASHRGGDEEDYDVIKGIETVVTDTLGHASTAYGFEVEDGNATAFERMLAVRDEGTSADPARYARMAGMLDIAQHADYTLLEIYGANDDWIGKNWRAVRRRRAGERFAFVVWDIERMTQLRDFDARCGGPGWSHCGDIAATDGVMRLHGWLRASPEYRIAFADRARRHLSDGGVLAAGPAARRYTELAARIEGAVVGESARWGDAEPQPRTARELHNLWTTFWAIYGAGAPWTRDAHWATERDRLLATFFPTRSDIVVGQLCAVGLYPPIGAVRAETWAGAGKTTVVGLAPDPAAPRCPATAEGGTIYYTLDGTDPRAAWSGDPAVPWSGRPSPSARAYQAPLAVAGYRLVKVRVAVAAGATWVWGPLVEVAAGTPRIVITELMYHPTADDPEFVELWNREPVPVDLSGATFTGIRAVLPAGTHVPAGGYLVLTDDPEAFAERYPNVAPDGLFAGSLANEGETIALADAAGRRLAGVTYDDEGFWPIGPDGFGYSLVPDDPTVNLADPEAWRASARRGGSPGAADPPPPYGLVVVNEVLAHAAPPLEGAVELFNPGTDPVAIGGWTLGDDRAGLDKFRVPEGVVIPAGGFVVLYADALGGGGAGPGSGGAGVEDRKPPGGGAVEINSGSGGAAVDGGRAGVGFVLDPRGGTVYVSSADARGEPTGGIRGAAYGPAEPGVSFGRHRTGVGAAFTALAARTFGVDEPASVEAFRTGTGRPNAPPAVGPIVVSEVLYAPVGGADAFVEIHNITGAPAPLYALTAPEQPWRLTGGATWTFPRGAVLPPGGRAVVAAVAPEAFRANPANASVPEDAPIWGPYAGRLDRPGPSVVIERPGESEAVKGAWIEVDRVTFYPGPPWPPLAAEGGRSLERRDAAAFGDDPANWLALARGGTPGRANTVPRVVHLPFLCGPGCRFPTHDPDG